MKKIIILLSIITVSFFANAENGYLKPHKGANWNGISGKISKALFHGGVTEDGIYDVTINGKVYNVSVIVMRQKYQNVLVKFVEGQYAKENANYGHLMDGEIIWWYGKQRWVSQGNGYVVMNDVYVAKCGNKGIIMKPEDLIIFVNKVQSDCNDNQQVKPDDEKKDETDQEDIFEIEDQDQKENGNDNGTTIHRGKNGTGIPVDPGSGPKVDPGFTDHGYSQVPSCGILFAETHKNMPYYNSVVSMVKTAEFGGGYGSIKDSYGVPKAVQIDYKKSCFGKTYHNRQVWKWVGIVGGIVITSGTLIYGARHGWFERTTGAQPPNENIGGEEIAPWTNSQGPGDGH